MKIHIYHHFDDCDLDKIKKQLDRIEEKLNELSGSDQLKQEIMDKLNKLKTDIEGTIS